MIHAKKSDIDKIFKILVVRVTDHSEEAAKIQYDPDAAAVKYVGGSTHSPLRTASHVVVNSVSDYVSDRVDTPLFANSHVVVNIAEPARFSSSANETHASDMCYFLCVSA